MMNSSGRQNDCLPLFCVCQQLLERNLVQDFRLHLDNGANAFDFGQEVAPDRIIVLEQMAGAITLMRAQPPFGVPLIGGRALASA